MVAHQFEYACVLKIVTLLEKVRRVYKQMISNHYDYDTQTVRPKSSYFSCALMALSALPSKMQTSRDLQTDRHSERQTYRHRDTQTVRYKSWAPDSGIAMTL